MVNYYSYVYLQAETGHAFVVIVHVARDLDNDSDWPLVLIDTDDNRVAITMPTNSMLLLEPSTVIHGRPSPLNGEYYANSFFYYKPLNGWDETEIHKSLSKRMEANGQAYYKHGTNGVRRNHGEL